MRRRTTLIAALAVLAACSQDDQSLPFESGPSKPVTSTMGSGNTTVSTPDGISLTVPAGALPAGTAITVAKLGRTVEQEIAGALGDAYLIGFDGVPTGDPSISFSFTLDQEATAGQLVGMVPVVLRLGGSGTTTAGNLTASRFRSPAVARAEAPGLSAEEKFKQLKELGIFDGFDGTGTTKGDLSRDKAAAIFQKIRDLALKDPKSPPLFTEPPADAWYQGFISVAKSANLLGRIDFGSEHDIFSKMSKFFELPLDDPALLEAFSAYLSGNGAAYLITYVDPTILAAYGITDFPSNDESSYPLIPLGSTSATFTFLCTGIQWPSAEDVSLCDENSIDVRVGSELLERYPATVVVPSYLMAQMTLGTGGTATGQVEYEAYLRSALSSGITGAGRTGSFDLDGSWSASGDTITIGGHDFLYATPDASTLILSVSDSVKIENNDGTESWEPVKVNVKLARQ